MLISLVCFIFAWLTFLTYGQACRELDPPIKYTELVQFTDEAINTFANKKNVASRADSTLSKLISAKSAHIESWLSKRHLSTQSPEEVVRQWRAYYAKNFILTKYPHNDPKIDKDIEILGDQIISQYSTPAFKERMQNLFKRSQQAAAVLVKSFNISENDKSQIVSRITQMKLYWPASFQKARNNSVPLDIIDWGIAYDPIPNEINMGLKSWSYPNEATYLAVFAHEIGHAIDSCRWGAFLKNSWPFKKVGDCLRTEKSAGAKTRDDSLMNQLLAAGTIDSNMAQALKAHPTCNKNHYPPKGRQKDQLPESFADWFSAEVLATMNEKIDYANFRADLCGQGTLTEGSSYPANDRRREAIYLTQPQIAKAMNRKTKYQYCAL